MEQAEYERLRAAEDHLWWFRALRRFIDVLLPEAKSGQQVLDIGAGTGGLLRHLEKQGRNIVGIDFSYAGLLLAENDKVAQADALSLPFGARQFDLVTCVDLLELGEIEPHRLVSEALRVVKPGGFGLFIAAAHQSLVSEHDRAVGSSRRYELSDLRALFADKAVSLKRSTYLFALLFPLLALRKKLNAQKQGESKSDVQNMPTLINEPIYWICWFESLILNFFNLPLGSSAVVLVQKNA